MLKRILLSGLLVTLALSLLIVPVNFIPAGRQAANADAGDSVPGQIIVGFRSGVSAATASAAVTQVLPSINGTITKTLSSALASTTGNTNTQTPTRAQLPSGVAESILVQLDDTSAEGMAAAISKFKGVKGVLFAEPNGIAGIPDNQSQADAAAASFSATNNILKSRGMTLGTTDDPSTQYLTNDTYLPYHQWGYYAIWADVTPTPPTSAPGVAVIDTGVDYNHVDLKNRVIKGKDYVNGDSDPMDDNGHGTHCAGIISAIANNNLGIVGVSPMSKIIAIKVLNANGWGTIYDIGTGIIDAANRSDLKVISLSLGTTIPYTYLENAVTYASSKNKLVVAAAGNSNTSTQFYPAAFTNCLAVAATTTNDAHASFSNYGSWVDVAEPGENILSTVPSFWGDTWAYLSGTSMAAPYCAACAARVWAQNSSWSATQVRNQLLNTVDFYPLETTKSWPSPSPFGRINLYRALGGSYTNKYWSESYILDAVSDAPMAGATSTLKQGTTTLNSQTVRVDGYNYGLLTPGSYNVSFKKAGYGEYLSSFTLPSANTYWGIIPMAPTGQAWLVAVSWYTGNTSANDMIAYVPANTTATSYTWVYWNTPGCMTGVPWARWNVEAAQSGYPQESVSLKKCIASKGYYQFYMSTWTGDTGYLATSNARATIFQNGKRVAGPILITTSGTGDDWYIGYIYSNKWYTANTIGDYISYSSTTSGGSEDGAQVVGLPTNAPVNNPIHIIPKTNPEPKTGNVDRPGI